MTEEELQPPPSLPEKEYTTEEDGKFGSKKPLPTILRLSVGPWLFATINSFQDVINLFFVGKAYSSEGTGIISGVGFIKPILFAICSFFANGLTVKVSYLIAMNRNDDAAQTVVDCMRVAILLSILTPAIFAGVGKPLLAALSMPELYVNEGYKYILATLSQVIFDAVFNCLTSMLMGEGRATLYACMELGAMALSTFVIDPLLMFCFKVPLWTIGFSYPCGNTILICGLMWAALKGKFTIKPEIRMFARKFNPVTWEVLKISIQPLLQMIIGMVPTLILQGVVVAAAAKQSLQAEATMVIGTTLKIYSMASGSCTGALIGLLAPVSWAFAKGLYRRCRDLFMNSWILSVLPYVIICPIMITKPSVLLSLWISDKKALEMANNLVQPMFYVLITFPFLQSVVYLLLALSRPIRALIPLIVKASLIIIMTIILNALTQNPRDIMYSFLTADVVGGIAAVLCYVFGAKEVARSSSDEGCLESDTAPDTRDQLQAGLL